MNFQELFNKIRMIDEGQCIGEGCPEAEAPDVEEDEELQVEGDSGWDDPAYEPRKPEPDEDWEYERKRQQQLDNPDDTPMSRYEPSEDELAADREEAARKHDELQRVLAMMDKMYGRKKPAPAREELGECGMAPMPSMSSIEAPKQQDSVTMNVSMNGSGAGGIRDLMAILRNIEDAAPGATVGHDHDSDDISIEKVPGFDNFIEKEGFANEPDEAYSDIADMTPQGNDLHGNASRGRQGNRYDGYSPRGVPTAESLVPGLAAMYEQIKAR